jgi:hypothetical protein
MKSGTQSNRQSAHRLTLIDRHGQEIAEAQDGDQASAEYSVSTVAEPSVQEVGSADVSRRHKLIAFVVVSAGCTAAAVITGSYAFWLSRRRMASEALLSVHDLLETCRDRVSRMEQDLSSISL